MTFEFGDDDYDEVDRFPLLWRWTSPGHAVFPPHVLERIHPLATATVSTIRARVAWHTEAGYPCLAEHGQFTHDLRLLDADSADHARVQRWLESLPVAADETVIVCWEKPLLAAVTAPFGLVTSRWDDFFYPSSDDAVVIPANATWMLAWGHEERFEFGVRDAE